MDARPFALIRTGDQWNRSRHESTALDVGAGVVSLATAAADPWQGEVGAAVRPSGLAFDAACRLYRSRPDAGQVERLRWAASDPLGPAAEQPEPVELLTAGPPGVHGDFTTADAVPPLRDPRGLAVDANGCLYVAETGTGRLIVHDLVARRLLRTLRLGTSAPLDVCAAGTTAWVVAGPPLRLVRLTARGGLVDVVPPAAVAEAAWATQWRVAVGSAGLPYVLACEPASGRAVVAQCGTGRVLDVEHASDIEVLTDGSVVVARRPGELFLRFGPDPRDGEATPLLARGYDGRGVACGPDGRAVFWTARGPRAAVPARLRYVPRGRVTTYRLDSGEYRTEWGRVFLDACVPEGTSLRVACATADEMGDEPTISRNEPDNHVPRPPREDLSPPLVPESLALDPLGLKSPEDELRLHPVHRRATGRELPWARTGGSDPYETYEAPVLAPPGRYLWVTVELAGTAARTPRLRALRAEHPSHDWVGRLPRAFARDPGVADFLRRYLAVFEGALGELDLRAAEREALLDPCGAPVEVLDWLAGFLGLALDAAWSEDVRRRVIAEAPFLLRRRGTLAGLERFLELITGERVLIVEHWRLRGLGAAMVGDAAGDTADGAVVGSSFRVGGAVGEPAAGEPSPDAFATHAHRFSVMIPALLDDATMASVRHVLAVHRPAHTVFDVCTLGAGMRVGMGLHVGLLSVVGRTGGFEELRVGDRVGVDGVTGRPSGSAAAGLSRLGEARVR